MSMAKTRFRRCADSTYLVAAVEVVRSHERDVLGRLLAQEEQGNGQHRRVLLVRSAKSHALGAGVVGNHLAATTVGAVFVTATQQHQLATGHR